METRKAAGVSFISGVAAFVALSAISILLYGRFNPERQYFSDLGAVSGPVGLAWNLGVFILGLLVIAGAFFYSDFLRKNKDMSGLYLVSGIALIVNSLFNDMAYPVEHNISAMAAFLTGSIATVLAFRVVNSPWKYVAPIFGLVALLATLFLLGSTVSAVTPYPGVVELFIIIPVIAWLAVFGLSLMHADRK